MNTLSPADVTEFNHNKVWWKCSTCGNKWEAVISSRTVGRGCPKCGKEINIKKKIQTEILKRGSLLDSGSSCLKEWDYDKNDTSPAEYTVGSGKSVWWKCGVCGKSWRAKIHHRVNGIGCPQCAKDIQSSFPEQAVYYYIKQCFADAINGDKTRISPYELDVYIPSLNVAIEYDGQAFHVDEKKDFRKNKLCADKGILLYRIRETECYAMDSTAEVICYSVRSQDNDNLEEVIRQLCQELTGEEQDIDIKRDYTDILNQFIKRKKDNSLESLYPEVAGKWDYSANGDIKPSMVLAGSHRKYWWLCDKGHSYINTVDAVVKGKGCAYCSKKKLLVGFNDFGTCYPEIAKEWDYEKNDGLTPEEVIGGSKKIWWICPKRHSYQATMNSRTNLGSGCPYCAGLLPIPGETDLATVRPELLKEWDYEKNDLGPDEVTPYSKKKMWWICPERHSYQADIVERTTNNNGCPYCSNMRVLTGFNDLASRFPELLEEWDYEKNELGPNLIPYGSGKKAWWKCKQCGYEWLSSIECRTRRGNGCRRCSRKRKRKHT